MTTLQVDAAYTRDKLLIDTYQAGNYTLQEIGEMFDLSRQRVHQVLQRHKIPRKPRIPDEVKDKAVELFLSGLSIPAVSQQLSLGLESTRQIIKKSNRSRAQGSFLSKYPLEIREGIYQQFLAGKSTLEIARQLDLPQSSVYALLRKAGIIQTVNA